MADAVKTDFFPDRSISLSFRRQRSWKEWQRQRFQNHKNQRDNMLTKQKRSMRMIPRWFPKNRLEKRFGLGYQGRFGKGNVVDGDFRASIGFAFKR